MIIQYLYKNIFRPHNLSLKSVYYGGYLHDKKVRVVNIQAHWTKQILDSQVVCIHAVDKVLVASTYDHLHNTNDSITSGVTHSLKRAISHQWKRARLWSQGEYLSCYGNFIMRLKPQWTLFLVGVVEGDGHSCFGDPSQTIFVHQILEISGTNLQGLTNQNKQYYIWAFKLCNPLS